MNDIPAVDVTDSDKLRLMHGKWGRVRGCISSITTDTNSGSWFVRFYGSQFRVVVFSSTVKKLISSERHFIRFKRKHIVIAGMVRDHPRYGLQMILEDPAQIQVARHESFEEDDFTTL